MSALLELEKEEERQRIRSILYLLGLSANYQGFYQLSDAVMLVREEPERLLWVTKCIYPDIAKRRRTTPAAVERNLRTAVRIIWEARAPLLWEVLGEHPEKRPPTARFIACLAGYAAGERRTPGAL